MEDGRIAEQLARDYLQARGLTCITGNYRCRYGEIDLIMRDHDTLVFIEVRYRRNTAFGGSTASINRAKISKLLRTASHYLQQKNISTMAVRLDVIAIDAQLSARKIKWIKNAIDATSLA